MGFIYLVFFIYIIYKKPDSFDAPKLGLLTLATALIGISVLKPNSIKTPYGELNDLKKQATETIQKADASVKKADDATKLALETIAVLTWNEGRFDSNVKHNEVIASKILKDLYGEKSSQYQHALQHKGILLTPPDELRNVPKAEIPKDLESPLYERYLEQK